MLIPERCRDQKPFRHRATTLPRSYRTPCRWRISGNPDTKSGLKRSEDSDTMHWKLKGFMNDRGVNVIDEWFRTLTPRARAKFETRWKYLFSARITEWRRPHFSRLRGACEGLCELRFESGNVQYRPIGFFGPEKREFTILICAQERGSRFVPSDACDTAQARKALILEKGERAGEPKILDSLY